jgi:quercetin dioxygenase-like cupin family protein
MPFVDRRELIEKELIPGFHVQFVHSERMTFAYWAIDAGAAFPEHSHHHEQVVHVLEGTFELTIGGEPQIVRPGVVGIIPGNVRHSGRAITACRVLDVFCPVREDYRGD